MNGIIPYTSVSIDADWRDYLKAVSSCFTFHNRVDIIQDLSKLWSNEGNPNYAMPCLSVRTGLDLFLRVKQFPVGSEVIMSAINIPDMVHVVRHHGLKIVPLDVSIDTAEPKSELLPRLVSDRTVAILIAHIYGKWCNMEPFVQFAREHGLTVIEDCAEAFCGFRLIGHPQSDIALFSFGVIKFCTAFGGAIAKVRDEKIFTEMVNMYASYQTQHRREYLKKVFKYFIPYMLLDCPSIIKPLMFLAQVFGIDHKKYVVKVLRGFPNQLIINIRKQPSSPLLHTLRSRLLSYSQSEFNEAQVKGEYVRERLPECVTLVGTQAPVSHYWLFPILVENPDTVVKLLNVFGVDAYRGATQLNVVEPETGCEDDNHKSDPLQSLYPVEARYLIDHVIYLPVNKFVPFHVLDRICKMVKRAIKYTQDSPAVRLRAKL